MTKWLLVLSALCVLPVRAGDPQAEALAAIRSFAETLAADTVGEFMDSFDLPDSDQRALRETVTALVTAAKVSSSIDVISASGNDQEQKFELDWYLQLRSRLQVGPTEERRQAIRATVTKRKKHWRITSLEPLSFFRAPTSSPEGGHSSGRS